MDKQTKSTQGLLSMKSPHDVKTTADRLVQVLEDKEMMILARINHSAAAQKIGETLRDTELIIFGNPNVGTALMQASQSIAIDLPMKALISKDENEQVWISYNDPYYLAQRHNLDGKDAVLEKIAGAFNNFSHAATKE